MTDSARDFRFAPPLAHVEDVGVTNEGSELATRSSRFFAAIVDVIVAGILLWVVSRLTPWNPFAPTGASPWTPNFVGATVGFALFIAAHAYMLVRHGQTLGKALLKIRIVRGDGSRASAARLIGLRYGVMSVANVLPVVAMVFGLPDLLLIFGKSRRCLHDVIADTLVVKV